MSPDTCIDLQKTVSVYNGRDRAQYCKQILQVHAQLMRLNGAEQLSCTYL